MKKAFLFSGLIIFLAACGGGSQPETSTTESTESSESTEVVDDAPETVEEDGGMVIIQLTTVGETMADMEFSPKQVRVGAGSIVRVVLDNVAEAAAMVHNFVLVERGSAEEIYPLAIEAGPDNNYVPEHDAIIAFTPMANPGETVEVEFEAPAAGIYQFICTYPGHASMKGIFVVE